MIGKKIQGEAAISNEERPTEMHDKIVKRGKKIKIEKQAERLGKGVILKK